MDYKSLLSNTLVAFVAQGVSFALSMATSLFVPKILGVEEFGYWQLFLFYASYSGFFHLGLNDGIYLIHGGKLRDEVDRRSIGSQFYLGMAVQILFSSVMILVACVSDFGSERAFVLLSTGVFVVLYNASGFLGYVFQAVNETKLFSFSAIVDRLTFLILLVMLIAIGCDSFEPYVVAYLVSRLMCLIFCCWQGRDLLTEGFVGLRQAANDAFRSICVGVKLMFANVASMLIMGIMRFAMDARWDITTFGMVSFGLSMTNFFMMFVGQVAMVLFPALRRASATERRAFF